MFYTFATSIGQKELAKDWQAFLDIPEKSAQTRPVFSFPVTGTLSTYLTYQHVSFNTRDTRDTRNLNYQLSTINFQLQN